MVVLGIESSCDETAAAVVVNGSEMLSSVVSSQISVHGPYGGVVPELASRKHIEAVVSVVRRALEAAGTTLADIDAIAVTRGPGLVGSLLVGFSFAKSLAYAGGIPWVGVDHLAAHVHSVFLTSDPPPFPFAALLVSGGHTAVYHARDHHTLELMGQTRDDAAGEAFDKVAKMLGLGYPGGVVIDRLALRGDPARIAFPRTYLDRDRFDFSFSGIKTAVKRYIEKHPDARSADIVAGFQEAVVDVLVDKIVLAAGKKGCGRLAVVGGVAANTRLRSRVISAAAEKDIRVYIPPVSLCGDNAAMVAAAGYHMVKAKKFGKLTDDVYSRSPLRLRP